MDHERIDKGLLTFTQICVEIDLNKGLPKQIQIVDKTKWNRKIDYDNMTFLCLICYKIGHIENT